MRFKRPSIAMMLMAALLVAADEPARIRDVANEVGVRFQFANGSRGRHDLPEIMGGGVAVIDLNDDDWPDLVFCNGGPIAPENGRDDPPCRTFLNEGNGHFRDVTNGVNAPGPSYAMGAAVGDFDNDGLDDLFITGWRDQRLYRNLGGRFEDVTDRAGLTSVLWSTSAAFADLDGDGDLDLYVANYAEFDPNLAPFCAAPDGKRDFCGPEDLQAQADRLYRNNGDGTFTDISVEAGVNRPGDRGLGILIADLAGDRQLDVYVANDGTECRLFENLGGMRFKDVGLAQGVALDGAGNALAGMGIALGDLDGDGRDDLVATNFFGRSTVAFRSLGDGRYEDQSAVLGLTSLTRSVLGFGVALVDLDNDGWLDLIQANGHVLDRKRLGQPTRMQTTLAWNRLGRFVSGNGQKGGPLDVPRLGRGLAVADLDRDGSPEVILASIDLPAAILRADPGSFRSLSLDLEGKHPCRSAIGAKVRAFVGKRWMVRQSVSGGSYLSSSAQEVHFGLGNEGKAEIVEVLWPSGRVERWRDCTAGRRRIEEGSGEVSR